MKKVITIQPRIPAASFSRLEVFTQCKHHAGLKFAHKIPEAEFPLLPGQSEKASDRGTRIHDNCELYVRAKGPLGVEGAKFFRPEFDMLRAMYAEKRVLIEDEWALTCEWERCDWRDREAWLRLKLDALVRLDEHTAVVIDFKTGKREGNEVKHAEQGQLYALVAFLLFPELEKITVEFWYLDKDDLSRQEYTREYALKFKQRWQNKITDMTTYLFTDERTDANPSIFTCRYCGYGPRGNGFCKRGV